MYRERSVKPPRTRLAKASKKAFVIGLEETAEPCYMFRRTCKCSSLKDIDKRSDYEWLTGQKLNGPMPLGIRSEAATK
jgi:hypothetical protein